MPSRPSAIAIVVVTFAVVLPKIADYRDVWDVVSTLSWEWVVVLAAATALNLATFAPPWMVTLPGPRLPAGARDDPGVDRALDRRTGRRGDRDGGLLGDAPRLGVPGGGR